MRPQFSTLDSPQEMVILLIEITVSTLRGILPAHLTTACSLRRNRSPSLSFTFYSLHLLKCLMENRDMK